MAETRDHIGVMATGPARFDSLQAVLAGVAPQLDRLYLYVNDGFDDLPDLSLLPNVVVMDGRDHAGDLSARGAALALQSVTDSIVFMLDDGFAYPRDYVSRNLDLLERMGGRCVVASQGVITPPRVDWHAEHVHAFAFGMALRSVQTCTLADIGTLCFDQRKLALDHAALLRETPIDLQISLAARSAGLPILVLPHGDAWLVPAAEPDPQAEAGAETAGPVSGGALAREVDWSFDIYADILRGAMKQAGVTAEEIGLDPELADCLRHGGRPSQWRQSLVGYRQRPQYLALLEPAAG